MKGIGLISMILILLMACSEGTETPGHAPKPTDGKSKFTQRINIDQKLYSNALKREVTYDVMLPEEYLTDDKLSFGVVYMLHGYGDNRSEWRNGIGLQQVYDHLRKNGVVKPMIFVIPQDRENSYWANLYDGSYCCEDMLIDELIPLVDRILRTKHSALNRAVCGYSMGGWGALSLAMRHADIFGTTVGMSPSMNTDDEYCSMSQDAFDIQWGRNFGGVGVSGASRLTSYYKSQCPLHIAEDGRMPDGLKIFIDCGRGDRLHVSSDLLDSILTAQGIEHEYHLRPGTHSPAYWHQSLELALPFVSNVFGQSQ